MNAVQALAVAPLQSLQVLYSYPGNAGTEWMKQFDNRLENIGRPGSFVGYGIGWLQLGYQQTSVVVSGIQRLCRLP
jgi:hypothetical protein